VAKFVNAIGDVSGKIGNLVFTRNRYSAVIRRRAVPVNTRTAPQRQQRGFLSAASAYWRGIIGSTGSQNAWNTFAANFPLHQGKGTKSAVYVTGQAFSVAINAMRSLFGLTAINHPPDTWGTDQPSAVTAAAIASTSLTISAIAGVTLDATHGVLVKATGPLSRGINFIGKSKYRTILATGPTVTLPLDCSAGYSAVYGNIPYKNSVIGVSVQVVKVKTATGITGADTACPGQPVFAKLVVG